MDNVIVNICYVVHMTLPCTKCTVTLHGSPNEISRGNFGTFVDVFKWNSFSSSGFEF